MIHLALVDLEFEWNHQELVDSEFGRNHQEPVDSAFGWIRQASFDLGVEPNRLVLADFVLNHQALAGLELDSASAPNQEAEPACCLLGLLECFDLEVEDSSEHFRFLVVDQVGVSSAPVLHHQRCRLVCSDLAFVPQVDSAHLLKSVRPVVPLLEFVVVRSLTPSECLARWTYHEKDHRQVGSDFVSYCLAAANLMLSLADSCSALERLDLSASLTVKNALAAEA